MRLLRSRAPQIRSFTQTSPFLAAKSRPLPPVPSFKGSIKTAPTKAKAPVQPSPPPPPPQQLPPVPRSVQGATLSKAEDYALRLLGPADSMLLYKAPRNVALFTSCCIAGSGLFYWVATVANGTLLEYTAPWYAKAVVLAGCMASSAIATAIVMTPHHLVKSISIVKQAEKQAMLRVKATRYFPFVKQAVFEVAPGQLMIDKNVAMSLGKGRPWWHVPMENATVWTNGTLKRPGADEGNALQRANRRMLNAGPAMFSQVKKMFDRTGMLYVRVNGSNWKMDLEGCELLENGEPLMKLGREVRVRNDAVSVLLQGVAGK